MESKEFLSIRQKLQKTQKQMAQLLGTSIKAIHSYEQGWRNIPVHVERQVLFLLMMSQGADVQNPCWVTKNCPVERKQQCPAWECHAGKLCWFINGTICEGEPQKDWRAKMKMCRSCEVFASFATDQGEEHS